MYKRQVFASVTESEGIYQPVYEVQGLPGAAFEIIAAEDVYTLDGTLRYSAGEIVDTITTEMCIRDSPDTAVIHVCKGHTAYHFPSIEKYHIPYL